MMKVTLNGDHKTVADNCTLGELIEQLGLTEKRIAVEVNRELIIRSEHASYKLSDGDQVEIVHAIGGGETRRTNHE